MGLLEFLPAAGASCPHRPRRLLQKEGRGEQQRKEEGEADWRRQWCWGLAGSWRPLLEPHLTPQQQTLVKQWALFLALLFIVGDSGCEG